MGVLKEGRAAGRRGRGRTALLTGVAVASLVMAAVPMAAPVAAQPRGGAIWPLTRRVGSDEGHYAWGAPGKTCGKPCSEPIGQTPLVTAVTRASMTPRVAESGGR